MTDLPTHRITTRDIEDYKREVLDNSVLITVDDAARVMACSTRKVYDLVREGELSGYNANYRRRGLRILAAELRDYVQSMRVESEKWRE